MPDQEVSADAEFDAAFKEATSPEPVAPPVEPPKTEAVSANAETPVITETEPASDAPPSESPSAPDGTGPQAAAPVEAPKDRPTQDDDTLLRRFADIVKAQPSPEARTQIQTAPAQTAPLFNEEEIKRLAAFEKDWPDIAAARALWERQEEARWRERLGYIFSQVAENVGPSLQQVRAIAEQQQVAALRSRVSDYDDIRDKVVDWAGKQPSYLKAAYEHVISQGTVDEVNDLIDRYRRETAPAQPATITKPTLVSSKPATELSDAAKKAARALAPVSSKRSDSTIPSLAESFDDAWKEANRAS